MDKRKLQHILVKHRRWLRDSKTGNRANLRGSDLRGSDLRGSDLSWSDLSWSDLRGSNLRGSDLRGSDLSGSNLRGSDLRRSNLSGSDLRGSDLSWSDLSGSNLSGSDLRGSDLSGTGVIIGHFVCWHVCASKQHLRIGCENHEWKTWENTGNDIAKRNNVLDEFKEYWPVLAAMRDVLQKRELGG